MEKKTEKMGLRYLFKHCAFNFSKDRLSFNLSKLSSDEQTRLMHLYLRSEGIKYTQRKRKK